MKVSATLFGWNEGALRVPSALAGITAILLLAGITYELTRKKEAAMIAALILIFFPLFLAAARNVRMDIPVTATMLGALYCFMRGRSHPWFLVGVGLFIGIGFLFKSVVVLLIIPVLVFFAFLYKERCLFLRKEFWLGIVLCVAVTLPWFLIAQSNYGGEFFGRFFGSQIGRVSVNAISSGISNGYLSWVFFKYGAPWSVASLLVLAWYALGFKKRTVDGERRSAWQTMTFALGSCALIAFPFLLSTTKLVTYLIPVYPFVVLFLAGLYAYLMSGTSEWKLRTRAGIILCFIVALFPTMREAFGDGVLYVSRASADEKEIGLSLADAPEKIPALLYEFPGDQAIQYYARRRVEHLREEAAWPLTPPFYLVIPSSLIEENDWLRAFSPSYKGEYLSLFPITR
jgi:4-amino-4-deoxy-L-arabinose transferase-like glycosyltransferase